MSTLSSNTSIARLWRLPLSGTYARSKNPPLPVSSATSDANNWRSACHFPFGLNSGHRTHGSWRPLEGVPRVLSASRSIGDHRDCILHIKIVCTGNLVILSQANRRAIYITFEIGVFLECRWYTIAPITRLACEFCSAEFADFNLSQSRSGTSGVTGLEPMRLV